MKTYAECMHGYYEFDGCLDIGQIREILGKKKVLFAYQKEERNGKIIFHKVIFDCGIV